jgi:flagellar motor switch protein FliG
MSTELALNGPADQKLATLPGRQKAAMLLISIGSERAAEILKHLNDREVEALSAEMAALSHVDAALTDAVVRDMASRVLARTSIASGGVDYAREVLTNLLGESRADEIITTLTTHPDARPFEFLRRTPPEQICAFLVDESPQSIALVIANLHSALGARVLAQLAPELQADVAIRIAGMNETNPEVVRDVEHQLRLKLSNVLTQEFSSAGGVDALAQILNQAGRSAERNVLQTIARDDAALAEEIRQRLFTFDDIVYITDRDVQLALREIDNKILTLALRGVSPELSEKIMSNMSQRAAELLREDMEASPPQKKAAVEEAQGQVVAVLRRLEDSGAITLAASEDAVEEVI